MTLQAYKRPLLPIVYEHWLPVLDWEGWYEASCRGRVRSVDRFVPNRWGGFTFRKGCIIAPWADKHGYLWVYLYRNGKATKRPVHQLVLGAFTGPCPPGEESLHGPGGNQDNRWPENLRYGTHAENCIDTVLHGRHRTTRGEQSPQARLTDAIVAECRRRYAAGEQIKPLAREFGIDNATMGCAVYGTSWQHVPADAVRSRGTVQGSAHPKAKLTEAVVLDARRRAREGVPVSVLAQEAGVADTVMGQAVKGRTWRHVPMPA